MSDRMSVTDAQAYLDTWSTGDSVDMWKTRAARTVVAQAEQIERLQSAISNIDTARGDCWMKHSPVTVSSSPAIWSYLRDRP